VRLRRELSCRLMWMRLVHPIWKPIGGFECCLVWERWLRDLTWACEAACGRSSRGAQKSERRGSGVGLNLFYICAMLVIAASWGQIHPGQEGYNVSFLTRTKP